MANRAWTLPSFQLEKQVVRLYARVTFGATGAPTLVTSVSKGIVSVTRNSTGNYTIVFGTTAASRDFYYRLLGIDASWDASGNSGTAPAAPLTYLTANAVATPASCSVTIQCTNSAGTATDPASGEAVWLEFILSNTGAA